MTHRWKTPVIAGAFACMCGAAEAQAQQQLYITCNVQVVRGESYAQTSDPNAPVIHYWTAFEPVPVNWNRDVSQRMWDYLIRRYGLTMSNIKSNAGCYENLRAGIESVEEAIVLENTAQRRSGSRRARTHVLTGWRLYGTAAAANPATTAPRSSGGEAASAEAAATYLGRRVQEVAYQEHVTTQRRVYERPFLRYDGGKLIVGWTETGADISPWSFWYEVNPCYISSTRFLNDVTGRTTIAITLLLSATTIEHYNYGDGRRGTRAVREVQIPFLRAGGTNAAQVRQAVMRLRDACRESDRP